MKNYLFTLLFISLPLSADTNFGLDLLSHIILNPGPRESKYPDTKDALKDKMVSKDIKVIIYPEFIESCQLLRPLISQKKIEIWKRKEACELHIEYLKKETQNAGGDTLFLKPEEYICSKPLKGYAYSCLK